MYISVSIKNFKSERMLDRSDKFSGLNFEENYSQLLVTLAKQ